VCGWEVGEGREAARGGGDLDTKRAAVVRQAHPKEAIVRHLIEGDRGKAGQGMLRVKEREGNGGRELRMW
jgi:hypothetical protein